MLLSLILVMILFINLRILDLVIIYNGNYVILGIYDIMLFLFIILDCSLYSKWYDFIFLLM